MLTLKSNAATICEAVVNLAGAPCKIYELDLSCQVPSNITLLNAVAAGVQLAVGDEFTAGDYTVVVSEIISGSPAGWKGKGFVKMKLVAGIVLAQISVNFENAVVNECYELASGSVVTDYDPNWGNILDADGAFNLLNEVKDAYTELLDLVANFDGSNAQKDAINKKLADLEHDKEGISNLAEITTDESDELIAKITDANQVINCLINQGNAGARVAASTENTCSLADLKAKVNGIHEAAEVANEIPEGKQVRNPENPCFPSSLPTLTSLTGIAPDYGIAKLNNCIKGNESMAFNASSDGITCLKGDPNVVFRGVWTVQSNDYNYFIIKKGKNVYYLTRHDNLSCREYNLASRETWANCLKAGGIKPALTYGNV